MDADGAGVHVHRMDVAYISALSALGGSVVGGLISGTATWLSQRTQVTASRRAQDKSRLEDLYKDFIIAASKLHGDALTSNDPKIQDILALYALINRMRVLSSPRIAICADQVMRTTLDTYFAPSKTISELYELIKGGRESDLDLLKDFSEMVREEIRTL
jgi:hypothetical protein